MDGRKPNPCSRSKLQPSPEMNRSGSASTDHELELQCADDSRSCPNAETSFQPKNRWMVQSRVVGSCQARSKGMNDADGSQGSLGGKLTQLTAVGIIIPQKATCRS